MEDDLDDLVQGLYGDDDGADDIEEETLESPGKTTNDFRFDVGEPDHVHTESKWRARELKEKQQQQKQQEDENVATANLLQEAETLISGTQQHQADSNVDTVARKDAFSASDRNEKDPRKAEATQPVQQAIEERKGTSSGNHTHGTTTGESAEVLKHAQGDAIDKSNMSSNPGTDGKDVTRTSQQVRPSTEQHRDGKQDQRDEGTNHRNYAGGASAGDSGMLSQDGSDGTMAKNGLLSASGARRNSRTGTSRPIHSSEPTQQPTNDRYGDEKQGQRANSTDTGTYMNDGATNDRVPSKNAEPSEESRNPKDVWMGDSSQLNGSNNVSQQSKAVNDHTGKMSDSTGRLSATTFAASQTAAATSVSTSGAGGKSTAMEGSESTVEADVSEKGADSFVVQPHEKSRQSGNSLVQNVTGLAGNISSEAEGDHENTNDNNVHVPVEGVADGVSNGQSEVKPRTESDVPPLPHDNAVNKAPDEEGEEEFSTDPLGTEFGLDNPHTSNLQENEGQMNDTTGATPEQERSPRRASFIDTHQVAQQWRELQFKNYGEWFDHPSSDEEDASHSRNDRFTRKELAVGDFEYELYNPQHYCLDYTPLTSIQPRNLDCTLRVKREDQDISLMILVSVSHEDDQLLAKTLNGIARNIESLERHLDIQWEEIALCIMVDGRQMMNEDLKNYVEQKLKLFDSSMIELFVDEQPTQVHMFERNLEIPRYIQQGDYYKPLQTLFCVKEYNGGRLHSHLWFFSGFCSQIRPQYTLLLDCGVEPTEDSLAVLIERLEEERTVAGVSGEIITRDLSLWNAIHAAQHFEQRLHSILTFAADSVSNYLANPASGFVAYEYRAIEGTALGKYLLAEERTPLELGPQKSNMYVADQRVLAYELAIHPTRRYKVCFDSRARALHSYPTNLLDLLKSRRPHYNGATMINWEFIKNFAGATLSKGDIVNPFNVALSLLQYCHKTISFFLDWFAIGIMFLVSYIVALVSLESESGGGANSAFAFTVGYTFLTVIQVMLGLGANPEDFRVVYWLISFAFGVIMLFLASLSIFLAIQAEFSMIALVSGTGSVTLILLAALFQGKLLNLLKALWQFVFIVPFFVNMVPIFAFCNLHDTSDSQALIYKSRRAPRPKAAAEEEQKGTGEKTVTTDRKKNKRSSKVAPAPSEQDEHMRDNLENSDTHLEKDTNTGLDDNGEGEEEPLLNHNRADDDDNNQVETSLMSLRHYRRRRSSVLGQPIDEKKAELYSNSVSEIMRSCREDDMWTAHKVVVDALSSEASRVRSIELETQEEHEKVKNVFSSFRTKVLAWWLFTNWILITAILWFGRTQEFAFGIAVLLGATVVGRVLGSFAYSLGQCWRHSMRPVRRWGSRCIVACCFRCCLSCSCCNKCCIRSCRQCFIKASLVKQAKQAQDEYDRSAMKTLKELEKSSLAPNRLRRLEKRFDRRRREGLQHYAATAEQYQSQTFVRPIDSSPKETPTSTGASNAKGYAERADLEEGSLSPRESRSSVGSRSPREGESRRPHRKGKRKKHRRRSSVVEGKQQHNVSASDKPPITPGTTRSQMPSSRRGPRRPSFLLQDDPVSGLYGSPQPRRHSQTTTPPTWQGMHPGVLSPASVVPTGGHVTGSNWHPGASTPLYMSTPGQRQSPAPASVGGRWSQSVDHPPQSAGSFPVSPAPFRNRRGSV